MDSQFSKTTAHFTQVNIRLEHCLASFHFMEEVGHAQGWLHPRGRHATDRRNENHDDKIVSTVLDPGT